MLKKWLSNNYACNDGTKWALENCTSLREAWDKASPEYLIWAFCRPRLATMGELGAFARFCAEQAGTYSEMAGPISEAVKYRHYTNAALRTVIDYAATYATYIDTVATVTDYEAIAIATSHATNLRRYAAAAAYTAAEYAVATAMASDISNSARYSQAAWIRHNMHPDFEAIERTLTNNNY